MTQQFYHGGWRTAGRKSSGRRKYGKAASKRVESAIRRRKKGTLKSGRSGKTVKSRKQAIAIGLSEARRKGAEVPPKRGGERAPAEGNARAANALGGVR